MSEPYPPSPTPPWARPVQSPSIQYLYDDTSVGDEITLNEDTTYLVSTTPKDPLDLDVPYELLLPDGTYPRQTKRIYVQKTNSLTTAKWQVTGTIVGCTSLVFDTIGWSAVLEWDGSGWQQVGGNCGRI